MFKFALIIVSVTMLAGCQASSSTPANNKVSQYEMKTAAGLTTPAAQPDKQSQRIGQCRNELDALRTFNLVSYDKYNAEFSRISEKTKKYLKIKNDIGEDVNDLAMPRYQFAIRDVCFRIRTDLAKAMIAMG